MAIHKASFTVYLSHCLFMVMATRQMERWGIGSTAVLLLGRILVCYTVPFGLYWLEKQCRALLKRKKHESIQNSPSPVYRNGAVFAIRKSQDSTSRPVSRRE